MAPGEMDPLLKQDSSNQYYFLNKDKLPKADTNITDSFKEVEVPPPRPNEDFAPRLIGNHTHKGSDIIGNSASNGSGFWSSLFGKKSQTSSRPYGEVGTLLKTRKAPVKIEPKVFFANERTFLAWLHLSVILAGASIAILAFADNNTNPFGQLYGIVLLPVAVAFIVYSLYQYTRRARMIRNRHPGPYEDTVGPTVLGVMLMISIVAQFALKLYEMNE